MKLKSDKVKEVQISKEWQSFLNEALDKILELSIIQKNTLGEFLKNIPHMIERELDKRVEESRAFRFQVKDQVYKYLIDFFKCIVTETNPIDILNRTNDLQLYWKNKGKYYLRSVETFEEIVLKRENIIVEFVVDTIEETRDSVKGHGRFFVPKALEKVSDKRYRLLFEYRGLTEDEKRSWKDLRRREIQSIFNKKALYLIGKIFCPLKGKESIFIKELNKFTKMTPRIKDIFMVKDRDYWERKLDSYMQSISLDLVNSDSALKQLLAVRIFKSVATDLVDLLTRISDQEREVWERKRNVVETHYVITLDKIREYAGKDFQKYVLDRALNNKRQMEEWENLFGIKVSNCEELQEKYPQWEKLPIDTKYFDKNFKWNLLAAVSRKNRLEDILDGILLKSENWQALNTLANKFRERIQLIYIDPPFNTGEEFSYRDRFAESTWLTMLENRISLSYHLLNRIGSLYCHLDRNSNHLGKFLLNEIFGQDNFRGEIVWKRLTYKQTQVKGYGVLHDTIYFYTKGKDYLWTDYRIPYDKERLKKYFRWIETPDGRIYKLTKDQLDGKKPIPPGRRFALNPIVNVNPNRPNLRYEFMGFLRTWKYTKEKMIELYEKGLIFQPTPHALPQKKQYLDESKGMKLNDLWTDISGLMGNSRENFGFSTQKPEALLKRIILASSRKGDWVLDFFLGSGTTVAVAHKLGRKWIGIEKGSHFYSVVLRRMKEVLAGRGKHEPGGISKEVDSSSTKFWNNGKTCCPTILRN